MTSFGFLRVTLAHRLSHSADMDGVSGGSATHRNLYRLSAPLSFGCGPGATVVPKQSRSSRGLQSCSHAERPNAKSRKRTQRVVPPPNSRLITDVSVGDEFIGTVSDVGPAESSWVDIGVYTKRGRPVRGRLRISPKRSGQAQSDVEGSVVPVYAHKVDRDAARIEVCRGVKPQHDEILSKDVRMLDSLLVGERLKGSVAALGKYGAVLDANISRTGKRGKLVPCLGLLPRRHFPENWASDADVVKRSGVEQILSVGDTVDVWVRAAHVENAFLLFDMSEVNAQQVEDDRRRYRQRARRRQRRPLTSALRKGEVRVGVVTDVARFGLFVDVGAKSNGLVHYSEMGERHRWDWKEVVDVGTEVSAEVLEVDGNRLSLRLLSIGDEELQEATEQAASATARVEDVERAVALQADASRRPFVRAASATASTASVSTGARYSESESLVDQGEDSTETEYDARDDVEDKDKEGDDEVVDKFSDDYFEDKYGF